MLPGVTHDTNILTVETAAEAAGNTALLGSLATVAAMLGLAAFLRAFPLPAGVGAEEAGLFGDAVRLALLGAAGTFGAGRLARVHPQIAGEAARVGLLFGLTALAMLAAYVGALRAGLAQWLAIAAMIGGGVLAQAGLWRASRLLGERVRAWLAPAGPTGPAMLVAVYAAEGNGYRLVDLQPRVDSVPEGARCCGVVLCPDPSCDGWAASTYRPGGGALSVRLFNVATFGDAVARLREELAGNAAG